MPKPKRAADSEEYKRQQLQLAKAFRGCFSTPDGKTVLAALKEEFYDAQMEPGANADFQIGRRDVVHRIMTMTELTNE